MTLSFAARRRVYALLPLAGLMVSLACTLPSASAQQRNPQQRVSNTIFEQKAESYRFERFRLDSPDGQRRWQVNVGIPLRGGKAPARPK